MRITSLLIENFCSIRRLEIDQLGDMVVIAGANGCGKTQIYHAIRLLKSTYGGYQPNEFQQWWGEFNINLNRPTEDLYRIFGDRSHPMRIRAAFDLASTEREFLVQNASQLIRDRTWVQIARDSGRKYMTPGVGDVQLQRKYGEKVEKISSEGVAHLQKDLQRGLLIAELTLQPDLSWDAAPNNALELVFSTYQPDKLGVIDYHGAQRNYNREQIGGINLNIESAEQKLRQHALYNWQQKYANVKSELAAGYIRDLIATEAGIAGC